jgi:hypothetical protein
MGYYIQTKVNTGKAAEIIREQGAKKLSGSFEARKEFEKGEGVICVVCNGPFDAAGFCHSSEEIDAFDRPDDPRPKTWLSMDRAMAEILTGFKAREH